MAKKHRAKGPSLSPEEISRRLQEHAKSLDKGFKQDESSTLGRVRTDLPDLGLRAGQYVGLAPRVTTWRVITLDQATVTREVRTQWQPGQCRVVLPRVVSRYAERACCGCVDVGLEAVEQLSGTCIVAALKRAPGPETLHRSPGPTAAVVGSLDAQEIFLVLPDTSGHPDWSLVLTTHGVRGYVQQARLFFPRVGEPVQAPVLGIWPDTPGD